jgi:hypothetical protein
MHQAFPQEETSVNKRIALSMSISLILLVGTTQLAYSQNKFVFSKDLRTIRAENPSSRIIPAPAIDPNVTVIAGNFSTYPNALYFSIWGNTIDQGVNGYPFQIWQAEAFTPTADAVVTEIDTSLGRQSSGNAGIELGLYADANGVPGKKIKSFHVSQLPAYGQCCGVSTATDKAGISVKAGVQYWVVVSTTPKDVDVYAWAFNSSDMTNHLGAERCTGSSTYCGSNSGKWVAYQYVQNGFQVLGK